MALGSSRMAPGALIQKKVNRKRPGILQSSVPGVSFYNRQLGYGVGPVRGNLVRQTISDPWNNRNQYGYLTRGLAGSLGLGKAAPMKNPGRYRTAAVQRGISFLKRGADFESAGSSKDTTKASFKTIEGEHTLQPGSTGIMRKIFKDKKKPTRQTKTGPLGLKKLY